MEEQESDYVLEATHINKSFGSLEVLHDINLKIKTGNFVSITGRSGAGKSTLLHILGGLDKADTGRVLICQKELNKLSAKDQMEFRNRTMGFVFQFHHLLPEFTALENVCMPLWIRGEKKDSALKKATHFLELVGMKNRLQHKPGQLSGGEQQRVAIARAVIGEPTLVFADEPTGNLDTENAEGVHQLFLKLRKELNLTLLVVTHNPTLANLADQKIEMRDGKILLP